MMEQFIDILKNDPNAAYDFICNNYYNMSKEELKNIAKELLYAIFDNATKEEHDKMLADVANELEDML